MPHPLNTYIWRRSSPSVLHCASQVALVVKNLCRRRKRRGFNPWVRKLPWSRKWQPTPVFLLGESHGLEPTRFLCPWKFPGKNTGVGCHFLLQGSFLTQGLNPGLLHLLHWQVDSLPLCHLGSSMLCLVLTMYLLHKI